MIVSEAVNKTTGWISFKTARGGLFFFMGLLMSFIAAAQPVAVQAYTDKSRVLLGEPLWLTLEVKTLNGVKPPGFKLDSIPHFEFLKKDSLSIVTKGDTSIYRQHYQLTSFDSGRWVIPQFTLRPFVKTASLLVDVVYTDNFDPAQPYHDVQEIKTVPFKIDADIEKWWYFGAAFLIFLTLLVYWLTRERKPRPVPVERTTDTAYQKAKLALKQLKESEPDYAQLVDIFRGYILERTGISSLHQTSNRLVEKIKPLVKDEDRYQALSGVLFLCDLVKFAKYNPDKDEAGAAFDVVDGSIDYIENELKIKPGVAFTA